jgi:hypothetical protein
MNNTLTYGVAALLGAVARVIIKGVWTWRSFTIGLASVAVAYPVAWLIVHFAAFDLVQDGAVVHSIFTLSGVLAMQIFERVDHLHVSAKMGGIEVKSEGDDT